jgi:hypothetical protein
MITSYMQTPAQAEPYPHTPPIPHEEWTTLQAIQRHLYNCTDPNDAAPTFNETVWILQNAPNETDPTKPQFLMAFHPTYNLLVASLFVHRPCPLPEPWTPSFHNDDFAAADSHSNTPFRTPDETTQFLESIATKPRIHRESIQRSRSRVHRSHRHRSTAHLTPASNTVATPTSDHPAAQPATTPNAPSARTRPDKWPDPDQASRKHRRPAPIAPLTCLAQLLQAAAAISAAIICTFAELATTTEQPTTLTATTHTHTLATSGQCI